MERRLSAIFAADVVGYSRLIRADEDGTLAALKALRLDRIEPKIAERNGRVVKLMGDGILAEFPSVIDAVRAAVEIQQTVAAHSANVPADKRIAFRVGINLGDVVIDGDDIHGDGVNVASRLEGLADPGGICVSDSVHEQVRDRLDLAFEDLGRRKVKNIDRPLRVWRWRADAPADAAEELETPEPLALPDRPSIAVLPFENMSGDPEQAYFSDGITEDLITGLSQISGIFVIARNSSFTYKGKAVKIPEVARDLGVRHVLEGSVRKAGARVRITAQLIDGADGGHLWAQKYDRDLTDIFAVQDDVTHEIVSALAARLTAEEAEHLDRNGPENVEAYDYLLRGRETILLHTKEANAEARAFFERALDLEPTYAAAFARLAEARLQEWQLRWTDSPAQALDGALELAERAIALDERLPLAHGVLGQVYLWRKEHDRALVEAELRVKLDPNDAEGCATLAMAYYFGGRPEASVDFTEKAIRLDPHYPFWYVFALGTAKYLMGRYAEALEAFRRSLIRNPNSYPIYFGLASCHANLVDRI